VKAEKIMELLGTSEKLIENVREGVYDRKYWNCTRRGNPGENSDKNLKDKIRVARGMLMQVSNGLEWDSFRD